MKSIYSYFIHSMLKYSYSICILTDDKTKCYTNDINELHTIGWKASVLPSTRYVCIWEHNILHLIYRTEEHLYIFSF